MKLAGRGSGARNARAMSQPGRPTTGPQPNHGVLLRPFYAKPLGLPPALAIRGTSDSESENAGNDALRYHSITSEPESPDDVFLSVVE